MSLGIIPAKKSFNQTNKILTNERKKIMVLNNEIMITLIRNSCKNLSDWAKRSENKKIEWLADNISQRSELIYFEIEHEDEDNEKYKLLTLELLNIHSFLNDLFYDFAKIIEESKYDYLWEYFTKITGGTIENKAFDESKKLKKFEINENYEINGFRVSNYGIKNDRLDYATLFKLVGNAVWNGEVTERIDPWEFIQKPEGFKDWGDYDIDAWYIVDDDTAQFLQDYTDELLIHNFEYDMFVWAWINRDNNEHPDLDVPNYKNLTIIKLSEMKKVGA